MRFTRFERYTPIDFNTRRQAAFARKQQRERERYPLLAEHVAGEQHTFDEEVLRRQRDADRFEADQRTFQARVWRKARARFLSLPEAIKVQIRAKWLTWPGPTNAITFSYIVDELSGDQARRVAEANAARPAIRQRVCASMGFQTALEVS